MTLTNKDYFKICTIILLFFLSLHLIVSFMAKDIKLDKEVLKLTNQLTEYKELLDELDAEQAIQIELLNNNLTDHEESIEINFDEINRLQNELINLKIESDRFSETSMIYCFDELWDYVELVEKRIK